MRLRTPTPSAGTLGDVHAHCRSPKAPPYGWSGGRALSALPGPTLPGGASVPASPRRRQPVPEPEKQGTRAEERHAISEDLLWQASVLFDFFRTAATSRAFRAALIGSRRVHPGTPQSGLRPRMGLGEDSGGSGEGSVKRSRDSRLDHRPSTVRGAQ